MKNHHFPRAQADLLRLRQSFSLWRCRWLRLHQWSGAGGAGGARREGDRREIGDAESMEKVEFSMGILWDS